MPLGRMYRTVYSMKVKTVELAFYKEIRKDEYFLPSQIGRLLLTLRFVLG